MDIMELGAIGEMIGGVAVIGSLLFVGIQIRTSVKTMRATSTYEAEHTWAVVNEQLALNPELGEAVDSWIYGSGELDARGAMLVKYWGRGVLQRTEAQYFLFKAGLGRWSADFPHRSDGVPVHESEVPVAVFQRFTKYGAICS